MEETAEEWRKKYEKSEDNLQKLKNLSVNAVRDYEDLQRKYDQNQKQYDELKKRLEETQNELQKVEAVLPSALDEYEQVQKEAAIEKHCREEAEKYARTVYKQNDQLKRQSAMLLDKLNGEFSAVEISIEELGVISERESSVETESMLDERDNLYRIIDDLKEQVLEVETKFKISERARIDAIENEAKAMTRYSEQQKLLLSTQKSLKEYETTLNKFKRVSTLALNEHDLMANKLQVSNKLQLEAEKYANQMMSQKNVAMRESSILLQNVTSGSQLQKAMLDIEDIQKALDTEKEAHKTEVAELQSTISDLKDAEKMKEFEDQVHTLVQQVEEQKRHYKDLDKWKEKLEKENRQLVDQLDVAEQKLRAPPPPPPPPPPPIPILQPLKNLLGRKKKKNALKGVPDVDTQTNKAYNEMMERIRSGNFTLRAAKQRRFSADANLEALFMREGGGVRRTSEPSLPDNMKIGEDKPSVSEPEGSAMEEIRGLLKGLKEKKTSGDMLGKSPGDSGLSDLEKTFQRVRGPALATIEERSSLGSPVSTPDPLPGRSPLGTVPLERMESTKV